MKRRPKQQPYVPRAVERILADDMRRHTIRALLDRGAIETPFGAVTKLRIGETLTEFPTALVEAVKAERRANLLDRPGDELTGLEVRGG